MLMMILRRKSNHLGNVNDDIAEEVKPFRALTDKQPSHQHFGYYLGNAVALSGEVGRFTVQHPLYILLVIGYNHKHNRSICVFTNASIRPCCTSIVIAEIVLSAAVYCLDDWQDEMGHGCSLVFC